MISEKIFEDILSKYPELIENQLKLIGRQVTLYGRRIDLLFEDKFKRKLIVELKAGPIKDEHIGQILSYEGMILSADDPTIRIMLVGTRVPPNLQRSLDHHGIAWKEITHNQLATFLVDKNDESFQTSFENQDIEKKKLMSKQNNGLIDLKSSQYNQNLNFNAQFLVSRLKNSEKYNCFKSILHLKNKNEEIANDILKTNLGNFKHQHFKEVIKLVDEPYPYSFNGKLNNRPWFKNLFNTPNTEYFFKSDIDKINKWFNFLINSEISVDARIDLLQKDPYKIRGIKTGFITLMYYLLDKQNFLIWFPNMHEGLKIIFPEIGEFKGVGSQYLLFNLKVKEFARKYDFEHTELDWIFYTKFNPN
jgi:hypothetical protein